MSVSDVSSTPVEIIAGRLLNNNASGGVKPPPPPPKKPEDNYRFYHCYLEWNGLNCHRVEKVNSDSAKDNSLLMFVPKYYPVAFDKHYISWNFRPKCNIIDNEQK